ncbi:MAG: hypothetical protein JNL80_18655 [Phycisphaerae bacterium]|nr:hypothetical protein [Phycisphaerae bacterium]
MTQLAAHVPFLARAEGFAHCTAVEAIAKGALESELPIAVIAGSRRMPFEALGRVAPDEPIQRLLHRHGLEITVTADAVRALAMALRQTRNNRCGIALVPNESLPYVISPLQAALPLPRLPEAALVLVVEDAPDTVPALCPRRLLGSLPIPIIEPATLDDLRAAVEQATRLSRAGQCAVAIVAHASLLRSTDTLQAEPNRMVDAIDAAAIIRRMRQSARIGETNDLLRMARRLELNRIVALPSPGEREPLGLICVGATFTAASYLLGELRLMGRVPMLKLGLARPLDGSVVTRLLARCDRVVLLEPRPGAIAPDVLEAAERGRGMGERLGELWTGKVPPPEDDDRGADGWSFADGEAVRPSALARKLLHLLHQLRPHHQVASRLAPAPADHERINVPPRGEQYGPAAAAELVRAILIEADALVRAELPGESGADVRTTALAIDGVQPMGEWDRTVIAEVWDRRRFAVEGVGAVRQAAREARPRVVVVPDIGGDDDIDLERLASASVPADSAARVLIRSADLNDRSGLREAIRQAAQGDGVTIIVGRDGPPARRDASGIERALSETDRLGFTPNQRLTWPVDVACELRPPTTEWLIERGLDRGSEEIVGSWFLEPAGASTRFRLSARPLLEQVEIIRTRPPAPMWRAADSERLAPPRPLHAQQGAWRAHCAGFRGDQPGLVATALVDAGALMGYRVQTAYFGHPIGRGRRAWAEVLFTRRVDGSGRGDASTSELGTTLPAETPYGEADLLVGADGVETLRAIGPDPALRVASADRTAAVVNIGPLEDQFDEQAVECCRKLAETVGAVAHPEHRAFGDFAVACRARFLTDRVIDIVLLGIAFQRGFIPTTVEAMETAVRRLESRGYGRCVDAFDYGRRLAVDPRLLELAHGGDDESRDASGERLLRRLLLETRTSGWGGKRRAEKFRALATESIRALPGLETSEAGHFARREFLVALHRCLTWGGMPLARRYADMVRSLHAADRGEAGFAMTRHVIRPLAEGMLIRDLLHLAAMSTSLEHRRRTRDRLAVRFARGDVMERRYLNRIEGTAFGKRFRLDVRTSDWPARILAVVAPWIPERVRGSKAEQEMRDYIVHLVERAIRGASDNPRQWSLVLRRLHESCEATSGFRDITSAELRARVEGFGEG